MTGASVLEREVEMLEQKREAAELVAQVSMNADYRAMVSFYERSKERLQKALMSTEMPGFDRGFIRGQLRVIEDVCKTHEQAVERIAELNRKITEIRGKLKAQREQGFRSPPPTMGARRPPTVPRPAPFPGARR